MSDPAITPAAYSLVSWARRGLAALVTGQPSTNYASLAVSVSLNTVLLDAAPLRLLGPGNITGLDARAVIRTDPKDTTDAFEPNYLAMVELAMPDLPWLFTPSGDIDGRVQPWICLVVVPDVPGASIEGSGGGLSILRMEAPLDPKVELPDLTTIDMWAHAQVIGGTEIDGDSAGTLSRLIAARRLQPSTGYIACIVPTFHAGVNAGLGLAVDDGDIALAWDVKTVTVPFVLPVYYHWRFRTGPGGDFASLAKQIMPPTVELDAGTRPMNVSLPGFGAAPFPGLTLGLEGALRTLHNTPSGWPSPAVAGIYKASLLETLEPPAATLPTVAPPTYGSAQTQTGLSPDATGKKPPVWMTDLNLDPRTRVAAAAGAEVVKKNQEALVASAWDQLGEIRKTNQFLRQAQLAREVSTSLNVRHLQRVKGDGVYLQMTSPMHRRVAISLADGKVTLRGHINTSRLPAGVTSPAMRRFARPAGNVGRQLPAAVPTLIDRLNQLPSVAAAGPATALQVTIPVQPPRGMVALENADPKAGISITKMKSAPIATSSGWSRTRVDVTQAAAIPASDLVLGEDDTHAPASAQSAADDPLKPDPAVAIFVVDWQADPNLPPILKGAQAHLPAPAAFPTDAAQLNVVQEHFRAAAGAVTAYLQVQSADPGKLPPLGGADGIAAARAQLNQRIDPATTIQLRIGARISLNKGPDALQPILTGPSFPQPMYTTLAELSPEWMLPGVSNIPMNCATMLRPNAQFIESYMIGLNEEFSRELLWRQYPTGLQATYFRSFWGASTLDIPAIDMFDPKLPLGAHVTARSGGTSLVLLIRANLFRRYPNAIVSAVAAQWTGTERILTDRRQYPTFRGEIGGDLTFFGFDLDDPWGVDDPNASKPGWYFVIEQHITEPRFGLEPDDEKDPGDPPLWNGARWKDAGSGTFLSPDSTGVSHPSREGVTWGQDAASMAYILMRSPSRVAMHALALASPPASAQEPATP